MLFNIQKFSLHDGPGIRTTLFFKGCNLRCLWCANPESQAMQPENMAGGPAGRRYTLEALLNEVMKDKPFYEKSGGGVTYSGGEPLLQAEFLLAFTELLHKNGVQAGIETALHIPTETCRRVLSGMAFAYIDFKHWEDGRHREGTGVGNGLILENMAAALAMDLPVTIRIPIIPGYNASLQDAAAFGARLREVGAREVHLLPFHQLGENKYAELGRPYAFAGKAQLQEEALAPYAEVLRTHGLAVQIGG